MSESNRLIAEKSPYLLQHAHNPVDWYAWGDEAFEAARDANKPIFLSIGYSTCHWCHVMERESFENPEIARLMNEAFISIKVDREERPDIDHLYMSVCQMMRERCGWPLNIVMTPDAKPFFATTYVPPTSRYQSVGMDELVPRLSRAWIERRDEINDSAEQITGLIEKAASSEAANTGASALSEFILTDAATRLREESDGEYGGFGSAPKFPMPHNLLFLLQRWRRTGETEFLEIVDKTLTAMLRGGIYDHIGFGFHRYSTDRKWLLPHFEKMLYDQALLLMAFSEAAIISEKDEFRKIARQISHFVCTELKDAGGGFYSAIDADSDGVEGQFYVWKTDELADILTPGEYEFVRAHFGVREGGNFEEEAPSGLLAGANILHLPLGQNQWSEGEYSTWEPIRQKLYQHRDTRILPFLDEKILADWNGLMISALARSSVLEGAGENLQFALSAAEFVFSEMVSGGRLFRRWKDGEAAIDGTASDYTFVAQAAIDLYLHSFDVQWLNRAIQLHDELTDRFEDTDQGGFYITASDSESLLVRQMDIHDGAIPSANSVALSNLIRLGHITGNDSFMAQARGLLAALSERIVAYPTAFSWLLSGLDHMLGPAVQVVIVGDPDSPDTMKVHGELRRLYAQHVVGVFKPAGQHTDLVGDLASYTLELSMINNRATAYVCVDHVCALPTNSVSEMQEMIVGNSGNH